MDTIEGNKLIAEFMELKGFDDSRYGKIYTHPSERGSTHSLKYHSSWDWLVPVVVKFKRIDSTYFIPYYKQKFHDFCDLLDESFYNTDYKISKVYEQLIKCIIWYNQQEGKHINE